MKSKSGNAIIVSVYSLALYYVMYRAMSYYIEGHNTKDFSSSMIMAVAGLVTIPFILYPYFYTPKPKGGGVGTKWEGALWIILTVVLALVLNVVLTRIPALMSDGAYQSSYAKITGGSMLDIILATCVVAPVLEELVFRGIIFSQCKDAFGAIVGVIFSAVLFGAMHFNLAQFIYGCIMGVVLSIMFNRMKRLYFPILAHALCNLATLLMTNYL
ncbi:MAG: CPBP family intramembrane metalloprotease [Lachnospiraceae bacterium]|nr:CPBP family intramembrane metalloprotease [Lachnospiraceae bacterium]